MVTNEKLINDLAQVKKITEESLAVFFGAEATWANLQKIEQLENKIHCFGTVKCHGEERFVELYIHETKNNQVEVFDCHR